VAKIKVPFVSLTLILGLSLLGFTNLTTPARATTNTIEWSGVNIPTEGEPGNWVLASGSDIRHLTMAIDGTLYGYVSPSGTSYTLFKSTDSGYSWSSTGEVTDTIVALATATDDANIVCYATAADVWQSTDAGSNFSPLPANPGGAGSDNIEITSIDAARLDSNSIIVIGTRDTDDSQYGGVYILDENEPPAGWINTNIGNYDVCAVACSPNFAANRQLIAVVTDEQDTFVTTKIGDTGWGEVIGDATIAGLVPRAAAIAFPDDYDATTEDYVLFMAIDTGSDNGDVYKVGGVSAPGSSVATDLNIGSAYGLSNVDVTGLAATGNAITANLLAGATSSTQVYISIDGGNNWTRSAKEPTGQTKTEVVMAPDFTSSGTAYAATSGTESAFSRTTDGGTTWNQVSLIDTTIGIGNILDLAISPDYSQNKALFMLTFGGKHSLWRSLSGGNKWERVFTSTLPNVDSVKLVELSPQYGNGSQVVFLAGVSNGNPAIWKSTDNGQIFTLRSAPFSIDTWAVADDTTLLIGSFDGNNGLVYRTTDSGLSYSAGAAAGTNPLNSIALSPDPEQDETILIGNTNGWVYWSSNDGTSFEPLGQQLPEGLSPTDISNISVAFDPKFDSNKTAYAASEAKATTENKERIYRFIIDKSDTWESIDSTLPTDSMLNQLMVSADGILYAANFMADGGMERCLNPTYPPGPTFETVTHGLDDRATLTGLWLCNNRLWSIDTQNTGLMTYIDGLTQRVVLVSPANKAPGIGTVTDSGVRDVKLDWEVLKEATKYEWQFNDERDFSTIPTEFEDETTASSARLPALEPVTKYYWRVRAIKPVLSPWSARWSFTTVLASPELLSPEAGVDEVPLEPVFQWSTVAGADSYEPLVSADASFANPLIAKIGITATAWQSDINLDPDATYYWKVRANGSNSYSAWSAVSAFTTESLPTPEPSLPAESSPQAESPPTLEPPASESPPILEPPASESSPPAELPPSPPLIQLTIPDWAIYSGLALLLTIALLLITLLVLRMRRF